jgi:hypothetical protein
MGYTTGELRIPLRAERHGGPEDEADNAAVESLKSEIEALLAANYDYQRVAPLGVEGGV